MPARFLAGGSAAALLVLASAAVAEAGCPGIHVDILGIRNDRGVVACALFESADGFPADYLRRATSIVVARVRDTQTRCDFPAVTPGTYALAVVHDENMNGRLDRNRLGIPEEGYGFSNDARGFLGAPSFPAAGFRYDGSRLELSISLEY